MKDTPNDSTTSTPQPDAALEKTTEQTAKKTTETTTPLRCFLSSVIAGALAFASYSLFSSIVQTYATKAVTSNNPLVINITSAVRTLVMGVMALATGVFAMVTIGLFLLGIQLMVQSFKKA
ncbi:MAG: hypothetical protein RLZZ535_2144 [Cyanobacteriota bacterium]|jgi:uncharacterized membrane protein HdeD (DUF308 family)